MKNLDYPMESGFFFDGKLFRDEDGMPHLFHPNIEEIMDKHVGELNKEINQRNAVKM